jgi:putative two-component system response regulator
MHPTAKKVLLVDDEIGTLELMGALLEPLGFSVSFAASSGDARRQLEAGPFDAVVSDVFFDGRSEGPQILTMTREIQPEAIVILMTGYAQIDGAVAAIKDGAVDYLQKPVEPAVLSATIHRALRERDLRGQQEEFTFQSMVNILSDLVSQTIERVDPYTAGHGERVRKYCREIAGGLGLDRVTSERLELAAIAHDYGKIYLDDLGFLTKQGPLTPAEYKEVQRHPEVGARKLGSHRELQDVCRFVAEHHERWDGAGYPLRLKGREISAAGRILGVVEVFDSLTTKRSYKNPWSLDKTIDFFEAQSGKAFEPEVLDVFLRQLEAHGSTWLNAPQRDLEAAGVPPGEAPGNGTSQG